MKRKLQLKSILLTAALFVGASAWAEQKDLIPEVFTWTNAPAITYDGFATEWAINQGGVVAAKSEGMPVPMQLSSSMLLLS